MKQNVLERRENIDGAELRFVTPRETNDQTLRLLVMLNGIGAGVDNWGTLLESLERPTVAIDVRESKHLKTVPTMRHYGEIVMNIVAKITEKPADVLGYSWGGLEAQQIAADYGERIGRLVLAATLPGQTFTVPGATALWGLASWDRSPEHLRQIAGDMYGGSIRTKPELVEHLRIAREVNPRTYLQQHAAALSCSTLRPFALPLVARLPSIRNETLILAGNDDPVIGMRNNHILNRLIPRSRLSIVDDGHLLLFTQADLVVPAIQRFLDDGEAPAGYLTAESTAHQPDRNNLAAAA